MIENVSALQNRPSKEWAIRAIGAFADIPLLDDPKEVTRYAAYGLRLLHIAAYEFPDFANSAFDLANELNTVLLQAAPYICDTAPKDLSRERIYVCLGAAGSLCFLQRMKGNSSYSWHAISALVWTRSFSGMKLLIAATP